jgi:leader peptidase (prepilin peptidase)/N-methyltransferase
MLNRLPVYFWIALIAVGLLSLFAGIVLNEIIYRYSLALKKIWLQDCLSFLHREKIKIQNVWQDCCARMRLGSGIARTRKFYQLIGHGWQTCLRRLRNDRFYAVILLVTVSVGMIVFLVFGWTLDMIFVLYFAWMLITISAIDFKTQYIPDWLSLLLLWSGLLLNCWYRFTDPSAAILGAAAGFVSLKIFQQLFMMIRKKQGLGSGDLKLTAALLAWLGIESLPMLLLSAAVMGLLYSMALLISRKIKWAGMIPFGPFLSLSAWLLMLFDHMPGLNIRLITW